MLDHVSIGVADLTRSAAFYDAALAPLGLRRCRERNDAIGYGVDRPTFWLIGMATRRGRSAMPGLGLHFSFTAKDRSAVRIFHAAALAHGARDNGPPGVRPEYDESFYGAFVLDPDGYKIEAVCRARVD